MGMLHSGNYMGKVHASTTKGRDKSGLMGCIKRDELHRVFDACDGNWSFQGRAHSCMQVPCLGGSAILNGRLGYSWASSTCRVTCPACFAYYVYPFEARALHARHGLLKLDLSMSRRSRCTTTVMTGVYNDP